jgi:hypothetical protein
MHFIDSDDGGDDGRSAIPSIKAVRKYNCDSNDDEYTVLEPVLTFDESTMEPQIAGA